MASELTVTTISIQYCGGWGYGKYARAVQAILAQEFEDSLAVQMIEDPGKTGNFESKCSWKLPYSKADQIGNPGFIFYF